MRKLQKLFMILFFGGFLAVLLYKLFYSWMEAIIFFTCVWLFFKYYFKAANALSNAYLKWHDKHKPKPQAKKRKRRNTNIKRVK